MQEKIQELIYGQEAFAGIECVQKEGGLCYHLCILKKEKDNANILKQQSNIASLDAVKELTEEGMPIFLNLNIKGILHRQLDYIPSSSEDALSAVFPSAKIEDFYVQQIVVQNNAFVSVVRRDTVQTLLKEFEEKDLWVVNVSIGPFMLEDLLPILPPILSIQTYQHLLEIEDKHIVSFSKSSTPTDKIFNIGDDQVEEELLMALTMAFWGLTQPTFSSLDIETVNERQEAFYYKKLFYYTSIFALGFFFVALLANYFLFENYNQQQQELKLEVAQQKNLLIQRDSLAKKYQDKKTLLGDQLHLGHSKSSFYADQLAATLPSTLSLTNLVLFPKQKEKGYSGEEKLPHYQNNKIVVTGECQASVFYNNWKRSLEELYWVKSIHNISYQNGANGHGIFKLEISLNDE